MYIHEYIHKFLEKITVTAEIAFIMYLTPGILFIKLSPP